MATVLRDIERPSILDRPAAPGPQRERSPRSADRWGVESSEPLLASAAPGPELADARRGGEATLDELLVGAWEGLSAHRPVACPVCAGPMVSQRSGVGGGCGDCGSRLL